MSNSWRSVVCRQVCASLFGVLALGIAGAEMSGHGAAQAQTQKFMGTQIPDPVGMTVLVRTTMTALNDANLTGNYTVFRDLGSPDFRNGNTAAKLAGVFASLRERKINLAPIVLSVPRYWQTRNRPLVEQSM